MIGYSFATVLFLAGAVTGWLERGSELSLWLLGLGWLLDFTLMGLSLLGWKTLWLWAELRPVGKTAHVLALALLLPLLALRFSGDISAFRLVMVFSALVWLIPGFDWFTVWHGRGVENYG